MISIMRVLGTGCDRLCSEIDFSLAMVRWTITFFYLNI